MLEIRVEASGKMAPVGHRHVDIDPLVPPIPMLPDKPGTQYRIFENCSGDLGFWIDLFHTLGGFPTNASI
jgi:hypothetical protein